jgi:hypothetical protein
MKKLLAFLGFIKKDKKTLLFDKIMKAGFPEREVFVSVADFFDGNEDTGSIGVNIYPEPPSLSEFHETLSKIENDGKTNSLLIRIADIEDCDWFYSDMVFINGDYTLNEVKKLFKSLKPDEVYEGLMYNENPNNIPNLNGGKSYSIWWD